MKSTLFLFVLIANVAFATPAPKRVVWQYATLKLDASRKIGNSYIFGSELFLPNRKIIFLESDKPNTPAVNTDLLNRLGAQGWELVAVTGNRGDEARYIFKRHK